MPSGVVIPQVDHGCFGSRKRKQQQRANAHGRRTATDADYQGRCAKDGPHRRQRKLFCVFKVSYYLSSRKGLCAVEVAQRFSAERDDRQQVGHPDENWDDGDAFFAGDAFGMRIEPRAGGEGDDKQRKRRERRVE